MNITEIAYHLNELTKKDKHPVGDLQKIRKDLGKIKTIRKNPLFERSSLRNEKYAFHHGGRNEIQFNIGEENTKDGIRFRYGLQFNLQKDATLTTPIETLSPKIQRFNELINSNSEIVNGLKMWYYQGFVFKSETKAGIIPDSWIQEGNSIMIGKYFQKKMDQITTKDIGTILDFFDKLLPIYEFVEGGSSLYNFGAQPNLQDIMVEILRKNNGPLTTKEIQRQIAEDDLWRMPGKGEPPSERQIHARITNYPQLFERKEILISLKTNSLKEKRMLRLTWNENAWELPSGHPWTKENQKNKDSAYENKYGFGHEEWLFNQRYNIDGYQYGYIQGLYEVLTTEFIDEVILFTIDQNTKDRLIVGRINNVELLDPEKPNKKVKDRYDQYYRDILTELKKVKADTSICKSSIFYPILRFKMEDAVIYDEPILVNELKTGRKYNRFKPYVIEGDLEKILKGTLKKRKFIFRPGKRKNENGEHTRTTNKHTSNIPGVHVKISKALEQFLKPEFEISKNNIAIETTEFGNNIADFVLEHKDKSYTIIEIKTSHNVRYNIREALGQLIDYAFWDDSIKIKELIIVSPSNLNEEHYSYLLRIKNAMKTNIQYWEYKDSSNTKFVKYK